MGARPATPIDLPALGAFVDDALRRPGGVIASVMPVPLSGRAIAGWKRVLPAVLGLRGPLHVYIEQQGRELRSVAIVYGAARPEWAILALIAVPEPHGADAAFRLLSAVSAAAARRGIHRLFAAVPDPEAGAPASVSQRSRETFFQAGFYSYTRETWFVRAQPFSEAPREVVARQAARRDAHDLFRFYVATTPHAVQRAEQLSVPDFDLGHRAALDPPYLLGGNPFGLRRAGVLISGDDLRTRAFAVGLRGADRHPHACKVRTADDDPTLARALLRGVAADLPPGRPLASCVRSYEERIARALIEEGFAEAATAMLFVKELAVRIEEPALATAVVR